MSRQPSGVLTLDVREPSIPGQVLPFVRVVAVVVEFLGAVRVMNVSPGLRADRVVPSIVSRDGRAGARRVRVLELGNEALALQAGEGFQLAKFNKGREKVQ